MNNTAVAVFAYKRPVHLLRVLRALTPQVRSRGIPVYIFLDGPKSDLDAPKVESCFSIAQIYQEKYGFVVHKKSFNHGLYMSLTSGVTEMFKQFQRLIVLEDDILASPYFIDYMLDGLSIYEENPRVASIHGYTLPFSSEVPETFFLRGADCWGWATWRDRWSLFRSDASNMVREIVERNLSKEFDLGGYVSNLRLLKNRAEHKSNSWAICWHASCFLAEKLTLYPGRSLVQNIGLDSSGEHCAQSSQHEVCLSPNPVRVAQVETIESFKMFNLYGRLQAPLPLTTRLYYRFRNKSSQFRQKLRSSLRNLFPSKLLVQGNFESYEDAILASSPYDGQAIISQVTEAASAVLRGDAAYERDGKAYISRPSDLKIYERLRILLKPNSTVVDFGGGVGGLFFNAPEVFPHNCRKIVIEQPSMVSAGRKLHQASDIDIQFIESRNISSLPKTDIIIFSAVLQYIKNSFEVLQEAIKACNPRTIILDRTAISHAKCTWQLQLNPGYYSSDVSYPIQFINIKDLLAALSGYRLVSSWSNPFDPDRPEHMGLEFKRIHGD